MIRFYCNWSHQFHTKKKKYQKKLQVTTICHLSTRLQFCTHSSIHRTITHSRSKFALPRTERQPIGRGLILFHSWQENLASEPHVRLCGIPPSHKNSLARSHTTEIIPSQWNDFEILQNWIFTYRNCDQVPWTLVWTQNFTQATGYFLQNNFAKI